MMILRDRNRPIDHELGETIHWGTRCLPFETKRVLTYHHYVAHDVVYTLTTMMAQLL